MSESKRREVLQLLRDYRTWHTPHGGAMPLDETGVIDAAYGPAGLIQAGQAFHKRDRYLLKQTYRNLDHALSILKVADHDLWIVLHRPYLSDVGDSSIVAEWRKKAERGNEDARGAAELHDLAVRVLSILLYKVELHVVFPKRMTSQEDKEIDRRNDELYSLYRRFREEGKNKTTAVKDSASITGYSESRAWEIVKVRESARDRAS